MNSGYGEFDYRNGDVYIGQWELTEKIKKRQGFGKFIHTVKQDGVELTEEYEGEWGNDKMHGYGKLKYLSGTVYEGEFSEGKQHGQGVYTFTNGGKYIGEWGLHRMHGNGTYIDPQGIEWEGIFVDGTYDSTIQKSLKLEHETTRKIEKLKETGKQQITEFYRAFAGESRGWKREFAKCLVQNSDDVGAFVAEPYSRWEERSGEEWKELVGTMVEVTPHVLRTPGDGHFLTDQRVFTPQLQREGQVIEFSKQTDRGRLELAIVFGENEKWNIFHTEKINT